MTQLAKTRGRGLPIGKTAAAFGLASMLAAIQTPLARADDFNHGHDGDRRRIEERREHERDIHVVPRVVYAPPPVVYVPPPPSAGINLIFPLHIR
jgi:hypothetical protein